nr:NF-X1-type zinc finger protein NFXL1-like [Lytechinus pictus]
MLLQEVKIDICDFERTWHIQQNQTVVVGEAEEEELQEKPTMLIYSVSKKLPDNHRLPMHGEIQHLQMETGKMGNSQRKKKQLHILHSMYHLQLKPRNNHPSQQLAQSPPQTKSLSEQFDYDSSSDEELDDGIVNKILQAYGGKLGDQGDGVLSESRQNLQEACQSGANDCSVCLGKIRRVDPIWTCDSCFTSLHLQCIQKWAKEGILQASLQKEDDDTSPAQNVWSCPNCRTEYPFTQCPRQYTCFCKKVVDSFFPGLHAVYLNRSIGQNAFCHPGACPPCPQTVRSKCHCGSQAPQLRRCSSRTWSCGKTCSKVLLCGQHTCTHPCHPGDCPPCPHTSRQPCLCKKKVMLRECASPTWECGEVCGCLSKKKSSNSFRMLDLNVTVAFRGQHLQVSGAMFVLARTWSCGKHYNSNVQKTFLHVEFLDDIHLALCLQMSRKKCRCGAREKMLPCQEEYKCDHRCTNMKNCKKHQCKRRCCNDDCPLCEQQCNKYLPCGNHKCPSLCHPGRCFPCPLMKELKCRCGHTKISVRCGREKTIKPPKCKKPCLIPPDCHHPVREKHSCHFNKCPPCKMKCNKILSCGHICPKKCHDAVVHKNVENKGPRAPWQPAPKLVTSIVNEPCPPCQYPIPTECLGKHEVTDLPCNRAAPFSCRRPCGRVLACTNHRCQFECHDVQGADDNTKAGTNCQECEEGCSKERPEGCKHHCRLPCHPGPCPPCKKTNKMRCHCKAMALYVECNAWLIANKSEREDLASCKGPCPHPLSCSHPCSKTCHSGACSDPKACTYKVPRRCPCKRRKREFFCHEAQGGKAKVECDDVCKQQKDKKLQQDEEKTRKAEEERLEKEKRDLEEYDRLTNKKKKQRKRREYVEEETLMEKHGKLILIGSSVIVVIAFMVYLLILQ